MSSISFKIGAGAVRFRTFVLVAWMCGALWGDQVGLKNGDRLTGAVIKSDGTHLTLKSSVIGTVNIPWEAVNTIASDTPLHVTLKSGQVLVGSVTTQDDRLVIENRDTGIVMAPKEAVRGIRSRDEQAAYEAEIVRLRNPGLLDLWNGFLSAGLSTSRGNAETANVNLGASAIRTTKRDKIAVNFNSLYSSNSTTGRTLVTANAMRGGVKYDLNISDRMFVFGFTDLEFDEFQKLDLRFVPGGGAGYHVLKTQNTQFDVQGGASLNKEFFSTGVHRSSPEGLLGQEFVHKINSITSIRQKATVFSNLGAGTYRVNLDLAAVTGIAKWLGWQVAVSDRFLSNPVPGLKRNDLLMTTGLRITFAK